MSCVAGQGSTNPDIGAALAAPPAAAASVGYVRLAHLSPDTPPVDVYLSSVAGGAPKKFPAVGYGTVDYGTSSEGAGTLVLYF